MSKKSDKLAKLKELTAGLAPQDPKQSSLMVGLTEQQEVIARLKLRGLRQKAIAQILDITPARVSQEVEAIRVHYAKFGSAIDQEVVIGESITLFTEVEQKAWEIFATDESKKLRALDTVLVAREKHLKLLMDLGILRRAAQAHEHTINAPAAVRSLTQEQKALIVAQILATSPGEAPEPPEDDIIDAEFTIENEDEE